MTALWNVSFQQLSTKLLDRQTLRARFARGVVWSLVGNAFGQIAKLVGSIVIARLLGQVGFGELGVIISTVGLFGVFAGMGLGTTATKYVADLRDRDVDRAGQTIGFLLKIGWATGVIVSFIVLFLAPLISNSILNAPHLVNGLRVGSALLLFNVLNGIQIGALVGLESFRVIALLAVVDGVLGLVFAAIGAKLWGLVGAVGGYGCGAVVLYLVSQLTLAYSCRRHNITISRQNTRADWNLLWRFGLPSLLVLASTQPFTWGVRVILAGQPDGYAQLGLLNAAFNWGSVLLFVPRQISRPALPILANLHGQNSSSEFIRLAGISFLLTQGTAIAIATPILVLSPLIMRSYGNSFVEGIPAMIVMVLANAISAGTLSFRDTIASSNRMWVQVLHSIIWGVVLIGSGLTFAGQGALGIAWAFFLAYLVLFFVQLVYLRSIYRFDIRSLFQRGGLLDISRLWSP